MVTLSSLIANCINSIYNSKKKENNNEEKSTFIHSVAGFGFDGSAGSDSSFDEPWELYPDGKTAVGTQPKDWMASSVCKNFIITITEELVAPDTDRMEEVNGHSVKMWNNYVGMFGIGATAPGYITLGTSWAYGDVTNVGKPGRYQ